MSHRFSGLLAACVTAVPLLISAHAPAGAVSGQDSPESTSITLTRWTSNADFQAGTPEGVTVQDGSLVLDAAAILSTTTYTDPFGDGATRSYDVGTWTSPTVSLDYPIDQAISSWNATTWSWPCRRTPRTSTPASTPSSAVAARSGARRHRRRW